MTNRKIAYRLAAPVLALLVFSSVSADERLCLESMIYPVKYNLFLKPIPGSAIKTPDGLDFRSLYTVTGVSFDDTSSAVQKTTQLTGTATKIRGDNSVVLELTGQAIVPSQTKGALVTTSNTQITLNRYRVGKSIIFLQNYSGSDWPPSFFGRYDIPVSSMTCNKF